MQVVIASEQRVVRTTDGSVYSLGGSGEYRFWARYLSVFDEVTVLARAEVAEDPFPVRTIASGANVRFHDLPSRLAFQDYLSLGYRLRNRIAESDFQTSACILRVPGLVGTLLYSRLKRTGHPYGVEVVGDPYEVFAPGVVTHPIRPLIRLLLTFWQRKQCANAVAAAYVTSHFLQDRYPAGRLAFHTHYSSVELPEEAYVAQPRVYANALSNEIRLISVGSMAQMYKGFDVLIEAVTLLTRTGTTVRLTLVGDGRYRETIQRQVDELGLAKHVSFAGQLPAGESIRAQLDDADVFVLASRTEGLPRALLEAMARGLPSIATDVGGVPELLPRACIVPPDDAQALSQKILELLARPDYLSQLSSSNLQKAREFDDRVLSRRRKQFYEHVRAMTEEWLQCNNR
jgi:phosphatidyl-myo-inositol dimannoside synthase